MQSKEQPTVSQFIPGLALGVGIGICLMLAIIIVMRLKNKKPDAARFRPTGIHPELTPFKNASVGYFSADSRGNIQTMNLALANILGFDDVVHALSSERFAPTIFCSDYERRVVLEQSIAEGRALDGFETKTHTKDDVQLHLRIFTNPRPLDGVEGVVEDISTQQAAWTALTREKASLENKTSRVERQLQDVSSELESVLAQKDDIKYELERQKEQYRKLVDTMLDGLVLFDAFGRIGFCSNRFAQMLGTTKEKIQGKDSYDLIDPPSVKTLATSMELWKRGQSKPFELTWTAKGGKKIQTALSAWPVMDKLGRLAGGFAVITDITWKKKAEEALRKAKEEAEAASRAKSDFLAAMSHEIRTPMNAVLGFAEILESEITDELHLQHLAAIRNGGKTLLSLINDILDLSRIEAGKLSLQTVPTDLFSLLQEVTNMFEKRAKAKGLDLPLVIDPKLPKTVLLDGNRIRQILINLVANAIKFTEHGFVEISVGVSPKDRRDEVDIKLVVRDSGMGIAGDELLSIFEAFEQRKGQDSNKFGGSGLGLAITRRLVELMKGTISVTSAVGRGSTFKVSIPSVTVVEKLIQYSTQEQETEFLFEQATVLVVDDDPANRALVRTWLEKSGMKVIEATNGRLGLSAIFKHNPAMVFMDRKMPVMTGDQALEAIRTKGTNRNLAVIAMSASVNKNSAKELAAKGYSGFIPKPITRIKLIEALKAHIPFKQISKESGHPSQTEISAKTSDEMTFSTDIIDIQSLLKSLSQEKDVWKKLVKAPVLDEIEEFASRICVMGHDHGASSLVAWSRQVEKKAQRLDLSGLSVELKKFPDLVGKIKELAG